MGYLIGMDIGTSSIKAILMSTDGKIKKSSHGDFNYTKDGKNIVETDALNYADVCFKAIKELSSEVNGDVLSICASSASGNLVILDKEMKPSTPIINWQDTRVTNEAKDILGEIATDEFYKKVGWSFGYTSLPLAQVCYIKKHNPEILENAGKICMSTEYLYYLLTGKWGITSSAATPFYFADQVKEEYMEDILEKLELDLSLFPPIKNPGYVLGTVAKEMCEKTGLNENTKVVLGTFDHPSAARGVGVFKEGEVLLSCGTSWVGFFPIKSRKKIEDAKMLIDPFLSKSGGCFGAMTSVASISERIRLYMNRYIDDSKNSYNIMSSLCLESEEGAGGLCINLREEPCDDKILKYPKKHIARAIMEGTVNLLKEKLDSLKEQGISAKKGIMVGGPSSDPVWVELIEKMCGIELKVIHGKFAGSVGATILAGMGDNIYKNEEDAIKKFNL